MASLKLHQLMGMCNLELVAPAGSLTAGLYALKAGADSVYFGLSKFSARQAAKNLSLSDVRRLKGMAESMGAHIFAALNTVISEDERAAVESLLPELILCGVDGIIVQDLGLASYIRHCFPSLPLHGSTQLAVHNRPGIETAKRLGFKRVVLSRELFLDEIREAGAISPSLEKEVFVHGALCYGFSGLCLASSMITGRSGNRGGCAQICRSWFERQKDKGYYFSLSDLDAGDLVFKLQNAGVTAVKIEGRLKSLAYVDNTTRYYRALLDGDKDKAAYYRDRSALGFSRPKSHGFLIPEKEKRLTNPDYPSHIGIPGARVEAVTKDQITITALAPLAAHDRLFRHPKGPPDEGETFPLDHFWSRAKRRRRIKKGERANLRGRFRVLKGEILMKTLAHDMHLKKLGSTTEPYRTPLPLYIALEDNEVRLGTDVFGQRLESRFSVTIEQSRSGRSFHEILMDRFQNAKGFSFKFDNLYSFANTPPIEDNLFIPPSNLKALKRDFYCEIQNKLHQLPCRYDDLTCLQPPSKPSLPPREKIVYENGFPFLIEGHIPRAETCPEIDGILYLSLPPVMFHPESLVPGIENLISANRSKEFSLGINNLGHLALAERLKQYPNVCCFYADYGLYTANHWTLRYLYHNLPSFQGAYLWLEATNTQNEAFMSRIEGMDGLSRWVRRIEFKEQFPLFVSRVCFHGYLGKPHCMRKCSGSLEKTIHQNGRSFKVRVERCITYVFLTN